MLQNATISIYVPYMKKNTEGTPVKVFGYQQTPIVAPNETYRADVQPFSLSQVQAEQWGLSNKAADVKKLIFDGAITLKTIVNNRAKVVSDFDESTVYYDIRALNIWPIHNTAILVPVQGEA